MLHNEIGVRLLFPRGKTAPRRLARLPACKFFNNSKACPKNRAGLHKSPPPAKSWRYHMTRATVRELHTKTNDIVNEVAGGEVFIIEIEGVAVAEIRPITRLPTPKTDRSQLI